MPRVHSGCEVLHFTTKKRDNQFGSNVRLLPIQDEPSTLTALFSNWNVVEYAPSLNRVRQIIAIWRRYRPYSRPLVEFNEIKITRCRDTGLGCYCIWVYAAPPTYLPGTLYGLRIAHETWQRRVRKMLRKKPVAIIDNREQVA